MRETSIVFVAAMLAGCGHPGVSYELRTARDTLREARDSLATQYEADRLHDAELALQRAEEAPDNSWRERDLAYIADREARIAMADASVEATRRALTEEQREYQRELERAAVERDRQLHAQQGQLEAMRRELEGVRTDLGHVRTELGRRGEALDARTRELAQREADLAVRERQLMAALEARSDVETQLGETERELAQVRADLGRVRGQLEERGQTLDERTRQLAARERELAVREEQLQAAIQARAESEQRADRAMQALGEMASVRQENGATVVTLSGEVLFQYDQADLRPMARQRLRAVANALKAQPDSTIVVEGHSDARGNEQYNRDLSARRAEAVRQFLIEEGVDPNRIQAVGLGEAQPVARNDTPEGRANNRRVEIVIRPSEARVSALGPATR